jgi:hypothetical protein
VFLNGIKYVFSEGREKMQDDERLGCPVTVKTDGNVEKCAFLYKTITV